MKRYYFILLAVALLGTGSISFAEQEKQVPQINAGQYDPQGEIIMVKAKGLVCEFCAKALEKVFLKKEEVSGLSVDLTTKEILINLKRGKSLDNETLTKLINDSGYNIEEIIRNSNEK